MSLKDHAKSENSNVVQMLGESSLESQLREPTPMCDQPTKNLESLAQAVTEGNRPATELFASQVFEHALQVAKLKLHGNKICRWIDPCDVAQNVAIKAFLLLTNPDCKTIVLSWPALLRLMTLRTITDTARSLRNDLQIIHSHAIIASEPSRDPDHCCTIESLEDRQDELAMIQSVEQQMPKQLQPIWHQRAQGFSWKAIAQIHGCHPQTLRIRFNKAVRKIQIGS
jgi:DNA-directed RNA polymerase specialized sigma24 family protein